jgi:uncharacterized protein YyaL (SSP411 family)
MAVYVAWGLIFSVYLGSTSFAATIQEHALMAPQSDHKHTNDLASEASPYLLQHAHNPVDWHPWGAEAIELARKEDRPIFLSIGYSTCYWCHVMERESFENEATAAVMNANFVNIKLDREQRPDVDEIYMTACQVFTQLTTGRASGGWPLSVFIDSKTLEPFYVGTYFPPNSGGGRPSFTQVLEGMANAWRSDRDGVREQAAKISELVVSSLQAGAAARALGSAQVEMAVDRLMSMHDRELGGFGNAPKFPQPVFLELLIDAGWERPAIREAVIRTLDAMATGGIHDHVGGGFHRYSVDEKWLVPHFEKMLYDNGQLASLYADVYERTGDAYYAQVLADLLDYVLLEMTEQNTGVFFSAQDAEVNTHEGENYLWSPEQVRSVLTDAGLSDDVPFALDYFGLDQGANFQDPHHPQLPPSNVLFLAERPDAFLIRTKMSEEDFAQALARVRRAMYDARQLRDQPGLDDKVITSWNGLMIRGMADGGRVLGRPEYIKAAERAADALLESMSTSDGSLLRAARDGKASINGFLEDYAFLARGLLALYQATGDERWMLEAIGLVEAARDRFWGDDGAWFDTMAGQDDLLVRSRNLGDGAVPSGIGTMLLVLLELAEATGEQTYLVDFESAMTRLSGSFAGNPVGSSYATLATSRALRLFPESLPTERDMPSSPIKVSAEPLALSLAVGQEAIVMVTIEIGKGHHINAHKPGMDELIGLDISMRGGRGVLALAEYPNGDLYRESIRVHARKIEIPVVVKRVEELSGRHVIQVRLQACTDVVCLPPQSFMLPIKITPSEETP